ncbi:MAG: DUF938 domain-containing protein [Pseudomonadales bacterium]
MSNTGKPFSQASENNKTPILACLTAAFANVDDVLEIGSGTGQHAVHFAANLPQLIWQTSDLEENHTGIRAWLEHAALENLRQPLLLDVSRRPWPQSRASAIFSANSLHIMSWQSVEQFFYGVGEVLDPAGQLCVYGPFNYDGRYTSESNARFDQWLKARDPRSGIRDFEAISKLAQAQGLSLVEDHALPANNRLLHWQLAPA